MWSKSKQAQRKNHDREDRVVCSFRCISFYMTNLNSNWINMGISWRWYYLGIHGFLWLGIEIELQVVRTFCFRIVFTCHYIMWAACLDQDIRTGFKLVKKCFFWTRTSYFKSSSELQFPDGMIFKIFNWDLQISWRSSEGKIQCGEGDSMKDREIIFHVCLTIM